LSRETKKPLAALKLVAAVSVPVVLLIALQRISIEQPLKAGDSAPALILQNPGAAIPICLSDLYSQRSAVLFFSADCPHCKQELKNFQKLWEALGGHLKFLLITMSDRVRTKSLLDSLGISVPVAIDREGRAQRSFGAFPVPALFLINAGGIIHMTSFGKRSLGVRKEQLETFLQTAEAGVRTSTGSR
jgi:peroxiredoxin